MIIVTADWHLDEHKPFSTIVEPNMNSRLHEQVEILGKIVDYIRSNPTELTLILGDVLGGLGNAVRDIISKDAFNAGYTIIQQIAQYSPVIILIGNHGWYKGGNSIIHVYGEIPNVQIVSTPSAWNGLSNISDFYFVPYPPGHKFNQELWNKWISEIPTPQNYWLATHMGFKGTEIGNYIDPEAVEIPDGFPFILTGHYHTFKLVRNILYVGPPYQLSFADEGQPRGFVVIEKNSNTGKPGFRHMPISGPSFVTINIYKQQEYDKWYESQQEHCYYRVLVNNPEIKIHEIHSHRVEIIRKVPESVILPDDSTKSINVEEDIVEWIKGLKTNLNRKKIKKTALEIWEAIE